MHHRCRTGIVNDNDIAYAAGSELAQLYRTRELSPVEVVQAVYRRMEVCEPRINAMARLTVDQAMAKARDAEAAYRRGDARKLEGIPVTIKDLQHTKGVRTDFGSKIFEGTIPDVDAPCVTRLNDAGCIMLGKSTASEFGWKGVGQSPVTGVTHNPWKHGRTSGGSSAGAAAGAAAGYGPFHQGGDGGGSIRIPAHFCGVFGLKPTHGRVPNWPMSNNDLATYMGPITRTVSDAALMLEAMAGPHPWDYTSLESRPIDYAAHLFGSMKGRRFAFSPDLGHAKVHPEVAALVARAVAAFEEMGATVEEVTPAWGPQGTELMTFFWPTVFAGYSRFFADWEDKMDPGLVQAIKSVQDIRLPEFMNMRSRRFAYCQSIHEFFEGWDFLLTPTVAVPAFGADEPAPPDWTTGHGVLAGWTPFSYPFNWSGNPAASVPCGFTSEGLPVGLQIVARRFDDLGVLQASAAFETARPWAQHRPPL
jgi:aspartyl-tRNA(Asn)/glutamyl-tRNA(Gln) amidotransferase subunit A